MRRIFLCGLLALALLASATPTLAAPAWAGDDGGTSFTSILGDWIQDLASVVGQLRPDRLGSDVQVSVDADQDGDGFGDASDLRRDRLGLRPDRLGHQAPAQ